MLITTVTSRDLPLTPQAGLLQTSDPDQSRVIVGNLADWLYNSGPIYNPRARRSLIEVQV